MTQENNFPTVRTGSLWLLVFTGACVARGLVWDWTSNSVEALKAILSALAATHATLVLGKGFISSKWSTPAAPGVTEETTKTVKTVSAPVVNSPITAQDVTIEAQGDIDVSKS